MDKNENVIAAERSENKIQENKDIQNNQDDWYWKNTVMSKSNKFENWEEGDVNLVMAFRMKQNDAQPRTFKVGNINSEGVVTIDLPKEIKTVLKQLKPLQ